MVAMDSIIKNTTGLNAYASGIYTEDGAGMEEIRTVRRMKNKPFKVPDIIVGAFGIVGEDGVERMYGWRVSGWRRDKRHGVIDEPAPQNNYSDSLYESMFKGW